VKVDLYSGFEGEPEIVILLGHQHDSEQSISVWTGYFDEMMNLVEPSPDGWKGIFHHYHCSSEWDGFGAWEDPDPTLTLSQLLQLVGNLQLSDSARLLLTSYIGLLRQAAERGVSVFIREE
jgi:hypothetical protein